MPSARQVNWAKVRVVLLSLAALAILGDLAYLLAGGSIFQQQSIVYLYIPDATGLVAGAPMRVDGIQVGKVSSVALSGSNVPLRVVRVVIQVDRDRLPRIPSDSLAEINPDTLVGDMFVNVSSGKSSRPLPPNGELFFHPQENLVKTLDLSQFDQVLRGIDAVLTDIEQGQSRVGQFVVGEAVYADLIKRVDEAERGFRAAINARTEFGKFIETDAFYRQISAPLVELEQSLERLRTARNGSGPFLNDPAMYNQMRQAAADLRASVASLRAGPFVASDAMYSAWNGSLQKLIDGVDRANAGPLLADTKWYGQIDDAARRLRDGVKDFRQNPRKYLRGKVF